MGEHYKVISLVTKSVITLVMKCAQGYAKLSLKVEVKFLF